MIKKIFKRFNIKDTIDKVVQAFNQELRVQHYEVRSNKVNTNIRLALVTDLHSCYYGENQMELLEAITSQDPDAILLGGDIFDSVISSQNTWIFLEAVSDKYPCFYVSGNNEHAIKSFSRIKQKLEKLNITILEGESRVIEINGEAINVCGVDDYDIGKKIFYKQLRNSIKDCNTSQYTLLLAHRPEKIIRYLAYDFDLILSGHAHGGQWRIPGVVNGLYAPNQGVFPKYAGGLYDYDGKVHIVSRGLARESTFIPRLNNPPELVIVNIKTTLLGEYMNKEIFETIDNKLAYKVPVHKGPINGIVTVPGSKSITNRALLIAALAEGKSTLEGVLFSDDSRHFLSSLQLLGFDIEIDEANKKVSVFGLGGKIPKEEATINVGSAGTAARFLTAMLALSNGIYVIECSQQMKNRPMKPLIDVLIDLGASFEYLEKDGFLPVRVTGNKGRGKNVSIDITKSTQFLSALLMVAPMTGNGMCIQITSDKKEGAYIRITTNMMQQFGIHAIYDGNNYIVSKGEKYRAKDYSIEPDVSAACYLYGLATLSGGTITVKGVYKELMQGDMKFLGVLEKLGSTLESTPEGIRLTGPKEGVYNGIDVDLNDFSDQTMTLSVLAAFAKSPTVIRNVAHIRLQECDRMQAIVNELTRVGISCKADGSHIHITPGQIKGAQIETYDDHRMSMAFSLLGIKAEGIVILDPMCCRKTFEDYFEVFDNLIKSNK